MNREQWLTDVGAGMEGLFRRKGFKIDPWRITCGWPSQAALGGRGRRIGECHGPKTSQGVYQIFISPLLDKPADVAGTICHELVHVVAGIEAAHGKGFVQVCKTMGLTGKPTSAGPGVVLAGDIARLTAKVGEYPHKAIVPIPKVAVNKGGMLRLECTECECVVMISLKWAAEAGMPQCGCGADMLPKAKGE